MKSREETPGFFAPLRVHFGWKTDVRFSVFADAILCQIVFMPGPDTTAPLERHSAVPRILRPFDRRFYFWAWIVAGVVLFTGFARSFFLRPLFKHTGLVLLLHVHGLVMSSWFALFFVQIYLVATRRLKLHKKIGLFGPVLAAAAWVVGLAVLVRAVLRHVPYGDPRFFSLLVAFDGLNLTMFAALVGSGILLRHRPDFHKRLMLLATISLLPPAAGRITEIYGAHDAIAVLLFMVGCVLVAALVDTLKYRRVHPAFAWGGIAVIASNLITYAA